MKAIIPFILYNKFELFLKIFHLFIDHFNWYFLLFFFLYINNLFICSWKNLSFFDLSPNIILSMLYCIQIRRLKWLYNLCDIQEVKIIQSIFKSINQRIIHYNLNFRWITTSPFPNVPFSLKFINPKFKMQYKV